MSEAISAKIKEIEAEVCSLLSVSQSVSYEEHLLQPPGAACVRTTSLVASRQRQVLGRACRPTLAREALQIGRERRCWCGAHRGWPLGPSLAGVHGAASTLAPLVQ